MTASAWQTAPGAAGKLCQQRQGQRSSPTPRSTFVGGHCVRIVLILGLLCIGLSLSSFQYVYLSVQLCKCAKEYTKTMSRMAPPSQLKSNSQQPAQAKRFAH